MVSPTTIKKISRSVDYPQPAYDHLRGHHFHILGLGEGVAVDQGLVPWCSKIIHMSECTFHTAAVDLGILEQLLADRIDFTFSRISASRN